MIYTDQRILALSTNSYVAAQQYRAGVDLLLSLWPGAIEAFDRAILQDPGFALAYAARARVHAVHARLPQAKADISRAERLVRHYGGARERSHVAVLSLAINGNASEALAGALSHINQWPRDVLIFGLILGAFGLLAFSGMANHDQARVDLCERYARYFAADDWWFLTYCGWSHAENGNTQQGTEMVLRALEIRHCNANGAHALIHAFHESGAHAEAQEMIAQWLPGYDRSGLLHGHIAWHGALFALEQGDELKALSYYKDYVAPSVSSGVPLNVISDSASFLWRLQAYGHDVPPDLWREAGVYASKHFQSPGFAFADFHMALIEAATGYAQSLERRRNGLSQLADRNVSPVDLVASKLCAAVQAFASGSYALCARILEPLGSDVVRIGGSGAQREVVDDMLVVSLMRSGEISKAQFALKRRLHRRPSLRDHRWLDSLPEN